MQSKAVINLKNIKQNAVAVKQKLKKAKLCAVVKADAYGHGAQKVASSIYDIADCYAVALVEEGVSLRLSGIDKEILVLIPVSPSQINRAVAYSLTFTVENARQLLEIERACINQNKKASVHLKMNTGMNRLGIDSIDQLKRILDLSLKLKMVSITGFYTHYACPQDDKSFNNATDKFLLANNIVKGYNNRITAHASASGGFLRGAYFDMVRVGILLYGYKPFDCDFCVSPAMKVYAPVISARQIQEGQSVLYGNQPLDKLQTVDIVQYGYADGLPRKQNAQLVNNRCMDMSAYSFKKNKDCVCVMSNAEELAKEYGTISYEILTKSAIRSWKIYVE